MYFNKLKQLRNKKELTQEQISQILDCPRTSYNNWEHNIIMIPIDIADKISVIYNVRLSYVLGIDKNSHINYKVKQMNYKILLENLHKLKEKNKHSYTYIAKHLQCSRSTCQRYFEGIYKIPIDRLILLSNIYKIDIDELCGKKKKDS